MDTAAETAADVRPFQVEIPEEELAELRRRIEATRWPSQELVADRSQGVRLATVQALARLGRARALRRRGAGCIQLTALMESCSGLSTRATRGLRYRETETPFRESVPRRG